MCLYLYFNKNIMKKERSPELEKAYREADKALQELFFRKREK
jgi:hypothetical protein